MTSISDLLLAGWRKNHTIARALLADADPSLMTRQSPGVVNHPAWTLSHLIFYHPAILSLAQGQSVDDPALAVDASIYDEGSTPIDDPTCYRSKEALLALYSHGHAQVETALRQVSPNLLAQPPGLERWSHAFPDSAQTLVYLMLIHEAQHLGQLMVWRRAVGLPLL